MYIQAGHKGETIVASLKKINIQRAKVTTMTHSCQSCAQADEGGASVVVGNNNNNNNNNNEL